MPPRLRIKICGIRTPDVARAAAEAGADAVGLVFDDRSPRFVTIDQARAVSAAVPPFVSVVGLFTTDDVAAIEPILDQVSLDVVQLHGNQGEDVIEALAPRRVLCAAAFNAESGPQLLHDWQARWKKYDHLSGLLLDTPDPLLAGGTGRSFDWEALDEARTNTRATLPIVLAGGLDPQNVTEAIQRVRPWAVDVSSGVESSRGVKDVEKVRAFCRAARSGA